MKRENYQDQCNNCKNKNTTKCASNDPYITWCSSHIRKNDVSIKFFELTTELYLDDDVLGMLFEKGLTLSKARDIYSSGILAIDGMLLKRDSKGFWAEYKVKELIRKVN